MHLLKKTIVSISRSIIMSQVARKHVFGVSDQVNTYKSAHLQKMASGLNVRFTDQGSQQVAALFSAYAKRKQVLFLC